MKLTVSLALTIQNHKWCCTNIILDLANIRIHLDMLKRMNEPKSKLCDRLVKRLEQSLQGVQTPDVNMAIPQQAFLPSSAGPGSEAIPYSDWQIFDQASLRDIPFATQWT